MAVKRLTPPKSTAKPAAAPQRPVTLATSAHAVEAAAATLTPGVQDATAGAGEAPVLPPSCRHATTRTRQRGAKIERYCERCGAGIDAATDARYTGPLK